MTLLSSLEKIDALHAQKGFFVSRRFTRDARAQSKLDRRIQLLCVHEDPNLIPIGFSVPVFKEVVSKVWLRPRHRVARDHYGLIEEPNPRAFLKAEAIDLQEYLQKWLEEPIKELMLNIDPALEVQHVTKRVERRFQPNELIVDEQEVDTIAAEIQLTAQIVRPAIISRYEVATWANPHI